MKPKRVSIDSQGYVFLFFFFIFLIQATLVHTHIHIPYSIYQHPSGFLDATAFQQGNVWQALKWVWVVNWIRVGCRICQNGRCTAVSVWTASIGRICDSQCCSFWLLLHTKCLQSTALWLVYEIGVTKK